jgi:hypothetical protein
LAGVSLASEALDGTVCALEDPNRSGQGRRDNRKEKVPMSEIIFVRGFME